MSVRIEHGDCLDVIPRLVAEGIVCDACVCDPPYHLTSGNISFDWDALKPGGTGGRLTGSVTPTNKAGRGHKRTGFMGQQWDGGDIAFRPETWATVASILRPGAFLVAFGGTRTYHRLVCAIEDAGFVIQDQIAWMFATGFPKRRDHLKPAFEPICLAYKPGGKRTMQIDECRVEITDRGGSWGTGRSDGSCWGPGRTNGGSKPEGQRHDAGRWPANVCLEDCDEVVECFPQSAGQLRRTGPEFGEKYSRGIYGDYGPIAEHEPRGDSGSAARFFFSAKAGQEDRFGSRHPTVKPVDLIRWLVKLVVTPGGMFIDPFAGSGTAAVAALAEGRNAILIEREDQYIADIRERVAFYEGDGRHSLASKSRRVTKPRGETPLFEQPYNPDQDALGSYHDAIAAIGADVKAGRRELPEMFKSTREGGGE